MNNSFTLSQRQEETNEFKKLNSNLNKNGFKRGESANFETEDFKNSGKIQTDLSRILNENENRKDKGSGT